MIEPKHNPLFKTANSLDEAMAEIKAELSLFDENQVHALVTMYHNTLVKALSYPCCMGVGDGSGKLFVYGSYEAIKAAQDLILNGPSKA